nr:hypothetical protein [FCB group bacterium]
MYTPPKPAETLEKAFICSIILPGKTEFEIDEQLDELELLVDTAGAEVVGRAVQNRP